MKRLIETLITGFILILSASCVKEASHADDPPAGHEEPATVILHLKIPEGFSAPMAPAEPKRESKIETVHILAFGGAGGGLELKYVVANAKDKIEEVFGTNLKSYAGDKSYEAIRRALAMTVGAKLFPDLATVSIPMWGTTDFLEVKGTITVPKMMLIRSIARVDIGVGGVTPESATAHTKIWNGKDCGGNAINFKLKEVYIISPNRKYGLMPRWDVFSVKKTQVTAPSLIAGDSKFDVATSITTFKYDGDAIKTTMNMVTPYSAASIFQKPTFG